MPHVLRVVVLGDNGPESFGEGPLTLHADHSTHTSEGTLPQGVYLLVVGQPAVIAKVKEVLASMEGVKADETLGFLGQQGPLPEPEPAPEVPAPAALPAPVPAAPVAESAPADAPAEPVAAETPAPDASAVAIDESAPAADASEDDSKPAK